MNGAPSVPIKKRNPCLACSFPPMPAPAWCCSCPRTLLPVLEICSHGGPRSAGSARRGWSLSAHSPDWGVGLGPSPYLYRTSPFFLESTKHWPGPLNPAFSGT